MDNVCAMYYVNRLGGRSPGLSHIAEQIWKICSHHAVNLQASYLPGAENHLADGLSRASLDRQDYKLNPAIFRLVQLRFGRFSVDLFASRQNRQLRRYASWRPDPRALWVDAMRHSWIKESAYGNPPFNFSTTYSVESAERGFNGNPGSSPVGISTLVASSALPPPGSASKPPRPVPSQSLEALSKLQPARSGAGDLQDD